MPRRSSPRSGPRPASRPASRPGARGRPGVPTFFASPEGLAAWFAQHHATAQALLVGFYKRESGRPSVTWPESVDEALVVGWIDGVRKRIDAVSYTIRFAAQPPSYRRTLIWWVISAKQEETRTTRLERLIAASARRRRL